MAKSILQKDLETHHIYNGNPNRKISDKHGFMVSIWPLCHRVRKHSVHNNRNDGKGLFLKQEYQK